jgi:hypothetical protein
MTLTNLRFETIEDLAAFWKLVAADRGYRVVIKDLTLQCNLRKEELDTALSEFHAIVLDNS